MIIRTKILRRLTILALLVFVLGAACAPAPKVGSEPSFWSGLTPGVSCPGLSVIRDAVREATYWNSVLIDPQVVS